MYTPSPWTKFMAFQLLCSAFLAAYGAETHFRFYMDDFYTGPQPTALRVVSGRSLNGTPPSPRQFGDIVALNDPLREGPDTGSARLGTAQGFAVRVSEGGVVSALSLHLVLEAGEHRGSSVVVEGRIDMGSATRESVVVGGTGRFRFAHGYMVSSNIEYDLASGGVVELNVCVVV